MYRNEIEELVFSAYDAIETPSGSATRLYTDEQLSAVPGRAKAWALGVGNPVPHADLRSGETVLDIGCGAGIDVLLAAREVGPSGRVIGVDGLADMVERGQASAAELGFDHVEFVHANMDDLPIPDGSIDVVISNGSINLAARKSRVLAEAWRVLKPGGRFVAADLTIIEEDIPPQILTHPSAWAG
jgi:ubiquinone/menaquinone biosynthesis C-methylase UbiE